MPRSESALRRVRPIPGFAVIHRGIMGNERQGLIRPVSPQPHRVKRVHLSRARRVRMLGRRGFPGNPKLVDLALGRKRVPRMATDEGHDWSGALAFASDSSAPLHDDGRSSDLVCLSRSRSWRTGREARYCCHSGRPRDGASGGRQRDGATESADIASGPPARFRCKSGATEFKNPTRQPPLPDQPPTRATAASRSPSAARG